MPHLHAQTTAKESWHCSSVRCMGWGGRDTAAAVGAAAAAASRALHATTLLPPAWSAMVGTGASGVLDGVACFVCCCVAAHDAGATRRLGMLRAVLRRGGPPAARQMVGCAPIIIAYACLATHTLGPWHPAFATLDASIERLFAVAGGDIVSDTFDAVDAALGGMGSDTWRIGRTPRLFGRLFMYSYVIIAICFIINTFFSVVLDAYFEAKSELLLDLEEGRRIERRGVRAVMQPITHAGRLPPEQVHLRSFAAGGIVGEGGGGVGDP